MSISADEFRTIIQRGHARQALKLLDLNGLDAQGLDLSPAGLNYGSFIVFKLNGAKFKGCNLQNANFSVAELRGADFTYALMEGVNLSQTDCREARFTSANMRAANLSDVDARFADFSDADLCDAYMVGFLGGANFNGARFNKRTILPDGTNWTEHTEIERFTDPTRPDFWLTPNAPPDFLESFIEEYKARKKNASP
jgi:uncharacterized protein YjbI with pentapeptide repeats